MPIIIPPESEYAKEMAKWNKPYVFRPYPRMLYRARKRDDGILALQDPRDEAWAASCQLIVQDESEEKDAVSRGWRVTQQEAMAYAEGLERDIAKAAAQRNYEDRNLSEAARAEAAEVEASTAEHVPVVPEASKRGRKAARH